MDGFGDAAVSGFGQGVAVLLVEACAVFADGT